LLLLRLGSGLALFHDCAIGLTASPHPQHFLWVLIEAAAGLLLCAGLWTPVAGGAVAVIGLGAIFWAGDPWFQMLLAVLGGGLAMVGPGVWSVDAQLFGRKRIRL
jgi:putative oxidoreductase